MNCHEMSPSISKRCVPVAGDKLSVFIVEFSMATVFRGVFDGKKTEVFFKASIQSTKLMVIDAWQLKGHSVLIQII